MFAVSPNLERVVTTATSLGADERDKTVVQIYPTSGEPPEHTITLDGWIGNAEWSPDGAWILLTRFRNDTDPGPDVGYREIVLIDAIGGAVRRHTLDLGGRFGRFVQWGDDNTLLAATSPQAAPAEPDRLVVLRRDGSAVRTVSLPAGKPCANVGSVAQPAPVRDGAILLCTLAGRTGVVTALRWDGTGPSVQVTRVTLAADPQAAPVLWDGGGTTVWIVGHGDRPEVRPTGTFAGNLGPARPALPAGTVRVLVGSSEALSSAAAHLAF